MAHHIVLDVFHVEVRVPAGLPDAATAAMHQPLDRPPFRRRLRRAAAKVIRSYPELARAAVRVTR